MEKLRAELRLLGAKHEDTGPPEVRSYVVDQFLQALQLHFTERAVNSFDVAAMRVVYTRWIKDLCQHGQATADANIILSFAVVGTPRQPPTVVADSNVVGIFRD
ncbi:hypothetical protein D3C85_646080 [compost metagenome]